MVRNKTIIVLIVLSVLMLVASLIISMYVPENVSEDNTRNFIGGAQGGVRIIVNPQSPVIENESE